MIRIVLAEDQSLLRGALVALLSLESDIEVVGTACDGEEAFALVRDLGPDLLVTDIEMPNASGLDLAERTKGLPAPPKVVIVTTFARPGYYRRALAAGAQGYLLKDMPGEELAAAIRRVAAGSRVYAPALADDGGVPEPVLTEREREVLRMVEEGCPNKDIADRLQLSPGTVRNYLTEASQKLGARNRVEAFRAARERGLL